MPRWEPDAIGRLSIAALELFGERGFDCVTVSEIADRAGLTERTFFRHFSDKREVLFAGADVLEAMIVEGVAAAPDAEALDLVVAGLASTSEMFAERRAFAAARTEIIEANPELLEREASKLVRLTAAVAGALRARDVTDAAAQLAAETGVGLFRVAFARWIAADRRGTLAAEIGRARDELRALAA